MAYNHVGTLCYVSGGPLIIPGASASEDIQVGVVSWGTGCALDGSPTVYSRVSNEFNWIKKHVCEESSSPPIELCEETSYAPTPTATTLSPTTSNFPTSTCEISSLGAVHLVEASSSPDHSKLNGFMESSDPHDIIGGTEVRYTECLMMYIVAILAD
jgi:secreted trypsin-like serine protease